MTKFQEKVYQATKQIPKGSVLSYKDLARVIGQPKTHRAVANALAKNRDKAVPCHRVIRSDGKIGGYSMGGSEVKKNILKRERAI